MHCCIPTPTTDNNTSTVMIWVILNDEIHKYNTRIKSAIHLYQSTTSAGLRSVSHKAAVLWNELPLTLKRMTSSTALKCHEPSGKCQGISHCLESGHPAGWVAVRWGKVQNSAAELCGRLCDTYNLNNTQPIVTKFLRGITTMNGRTWVVPRDSPSKSKMASGNHIEFRKILLSLYSMKIFAKMQHGADHGQQYRKAVVALKKHNCKTAFSLQWNQECATTASSSIEMKALSCFRIIIR